jgi:hypothetical protein
VAKLNLGQVLSNMAQATSGMLAGQTAAEQELRRREMEKQERIRQSHATYLNVLPSLDRQSRMLLLGGILPEIDNMAAGREFDYKAPAPVDMSSYQGIFGGGGRTPAPAPMAPTMTGDRPMVGESAFPQGPPAPVQPMGPAMSFPLFGIPGVPPELAPQVPFAMPLGQPQVPMQQLPVAKVEAPQSVTVKARPRPQTAPAPAPRPGIQTRFGTLSMRGVDPKEAKGVYDSIDRDLRDLTTLYASNPEVMKQVVQLAAGRPTKIPETPEEFSAAQQFRTAMLGATAGLKAYAPAGADYKARVEGLTKGMERLPYLSDTDITGGVLQLWDEREALEKESKGRAIVPGPLIGQRKNIEEIRAALARGDDAQAARLSRSVAASVQSPLKPEEKRKAINDFLGALKDLAPDQASDPNVQRQLAQQFGVIDFIEGIEPGTLKFGGEELERRWKAALDRTMQGGKLSPGAQKLAYDELVSLARLTGRKVTVTAKELFALSPELALKMKREQTLFDFKVKEHEWKVAERPIRMEMLNKGLKKLDLSIEHAKLTNKNLRTGKGGDKWWRSATFTKLKDAHNNAISAYQSHLTRSKLVEGDFDPNRPGGGPEERAAARLYQNIEKTRKDMDGFIQRNGMDPGTIERMGEGEMLTPEGLAKTQPPKTPLPTKPGGRKPLNQMSPDEVAAAFAAAIKKRSGAK